MTCPNCKKAFVPPFESHFVPGGEYHSPFYICDAPVTHNAAPDAAVPAVASPAREVREVSYSGWVHTLDLPRHKTPM